MVKKAKKVARKATPTQGTKRERLAPVAESYFASAKKDIEFIRSGSQMLDLALGGGWAENRIANVIGDKSTGKTLLMIEACANFAMKYPKGRIRYRESEAAFDTGYASALGMPVDRIDFGGDPLESVEDLFEDLTHIVAKAKQPELVVVDSLDALSDRSEMAREIDEASYGANKAKLMSQLFRRLTAKMARKNVTLIIVSQVRDKIGVSFGDKHTRTGGRALDFYASQVAMLANLGRIPKIVNGTKRVVGVKVLAKMQKNKIALPFREAEFSINFGYGVNDAQSCVDFLKQTKRFRAKDYHMSEDEAKDTLKTLLAMEPDEMQDLTAQLHGACSDVWYEIENKLMPARAKYASR